MSIRFKIVLGFLILAIMLFIAGSWSIYELNSIGSSVPKMLNDNYLSIHAAKKMIEALEREDSAILLLLLGKQDEGRFILSTADSMFSNYFKKAYANITITGEQTHLDAIKIRYQIYKNLWQQPIVGTQNEGNMDYYSREPQPTGSGVLALSYLYCRFCPFWVLLKSYFIETKYLQWPEITFIIAQEKQFKLSQVCTED